jgi:hypothetical protein
MGLVRIEDLERHHAAQRQLLGAVHLAHGAARHERVDAVLAVDLAPDERIWSRRLRLGGSGAHRGP